MLLLSTYVIIARYWLEKFSSVKIFLYIRRICIQKSNLNHFLYPLYKFYSHSFNQTLHSSSRTRTTSTSTCELDHHSAILYINQFTRPTISVQDRQHHRVDKLLHLVSLPINKLDTIDQILSCSTVVGVKLLLQLIKHLSFGLLWLKKLDVFRLDLKFLKVTQIFFYHRNRASWNSHIWLIYCQSLCWLQLINVKGTLFYVLYTHFAISIVNIICCEMIKLCISEHIIYWYITYLII